MYPAREGQWCSSLRRAFKVKPTESPYFPAYLQRLEKLVQANELLKEEKQRCEETGDYGPVQAVITLITRALIRLHLVADKL
jgi:hypothetical protein